ncbi:MAG: COX15/CtaA family protein [Micavibrio sp.]|nr:COX15/CtaA family protein [Micavibrio sp.]
MTSPNPSIRPLIIWLSFCIFMVFAMTIIGAVTRLTGSGLSIVEWNPLIGAIPPLSVAEWNATFDLYKQSPEYQKVNFWMGLEDFKRIFFWEWLHRLWGRLIGLVFALPLVFFWLRGMVPSKYKPRFLGLLALGAAQGFMGWYMVMSGLVDNPAVSHFRLAAHLSLALIIYMIMLWQVMTLKGVSRASDRPLFWHSIVAFGVVCITVFWGAFTAGLDAGLLYNDTFPHMGASLVPQDLPQDQTLWWSLTHNASGVQFAHRWLAIVSFVVVIVLPLHALVRGKVTANVMLAGLIVLGQFGLGMATLFSNVNIALAASHQAGAVILLGVLVSCLHRLRKD